MFLALVRSKLQFHADLLGLSIFPGPTHYPGHYHRPQATDAHMLSLVLCVSGLGSLEMSGLCQKSILRTERHHMELAIHDPGHVYSIDV